MRYVKVDEEWLASVRRAADEGRLVFVLRNRSLIDLLCLRGLCVHYDLPRVSFVTGLSPLLYTPLWLWFIRLFIPKAVKRRFSIALRSGGSAVVFLRRPATLGTVASRPVKVDGIRIAVETQTTFSDPLLALPTVFLWGESPMKRFPGTMDFFFGSNEYPRLLRSIWLLVQRRSVHQLLVGEPLDLSAIREERGVSDDTLAGIVRAGVGRQIEMLRRTRLGSLTKPSSRVKAEVLSSPRLKRELDQIATEMKIPKAEVVPRARGIINKLAADYHPRVLALFAFVMSFVWKRIYTGIEVSEEDMKRMRDMVSRGPTLILPTHKSHIDYMAVSQVMLTHNMMLPHIAAGQNLSFWPLGWLFRSSGAFFIRRKFVNDRFYSSVVNAYLRRLVQEGYSIEIFIEGGRSRTGKLLRPKLGMLEMSIRALAVTPRLDLGIVPVFIGYERVIEETAYVKESMGRKKKAESIKGLFKSTKVLMSRYGRLYVRVGEPFTVGDIMADMGVERKELEKLSFRREVALAIALRNYSAISKITVVTPSAVLATVLLTCCEKNLKHAVLRERAVWLVDLMQRAGATVSEFVEKWLEPSRNGGDDMLDRTIKALVKGGRVAVKGKEQRNYVVSDNQRLPLDYYKNNTIHFLVPLSLVCTSCLIREGHSTLDEVYEDAERVSRFYRWEFMLNPSDSKRCVDDAVEILSDKGVVEATGGAVHVLDRSAALFLTDILRNSAEAYYAVIHTIRSKALGELEGDTAKKSTAFLVEKLRSGELTKPESNSRLNIQNAILAFKELKLLRPAEGETPFQEGHLGDRVYRYLKSVIELK